MISIKKYQGLIQNMPYLDQSFTVKAENKKWNHYGNPEWVKSLNAEIFTESKEYSISRRTILGMEISKESLLHTLYWGYPKGMQGEKNYKGILNAIPAIVSILQEAKRSRIDSNEDVIEVLHKLIMIEGLGISTATKFLYFSQIEFKGYKALILDQRILDTFNKSIFLEYVTLKSINRDMAVKYYVEYLELTSKLASKMKTEPDRIEMFLYEFGNNLKPEM